MEFSGLRWSSPDSGGDPLNPLEIRWIHRILLDFLVLLRVINSHVTQFWSHFPEQCRTIQTRHDWGLSGSSSYRCLKECPFWPPLKTVQLLNNDCGGTRRNSAPCSQESHNLKLEDEYGIFTCARDGQTPLGGQVLVLFMISVMPKTRSLLASSRVLLGRAFCIRTKQV